MLFPLLLLPTAADGVTKRVGSVRGLCTISASADNCNAHSEDTSSGPLCGGMRITLDAGAWQPDWGAVLQQPSNTMFGKQQTAALCRFCVSHLYHPSGVLVCWRQQPQSCTSVTSPFPIIVILEPAHAACFVSLVTDWFQTPRAWWKAAQETPIIDDDKYSGQPSCCVLEYNLGLISSSQCGGSRQTANNTLRVNDSANTPNQPANTGAASRKLQGNEDDATLSYMKPEYEGYTGTHFTGTVNAIWGTWYATNMANADKWENAGAL